MKNKWWKIPRCDLNRLNANLRLTMNYQIFLSHTISSASIFHGGLEHKYCVEGNYSGNPAMRERVYIWSFHLSLDVREQNMKVLTPQPKKHGGPVRHRNAHCL